MTPPVNSYLEKLYQTYEQEIRGENKPIEDVDNRPNYIGMCMNMMETPQMKIKCLRKIRELTVMNPFYQYRIDRFIDAINDRYEPTDQPGFVEFIRGEKDSALNESASMGDYLTFLSDQVGPGRGGPPPKVIQLKASGAEQDDEEPPTTARTKKFEKEEAKVGTIEQKEYISEQDTCKPECERKLQMGKDMIWVSGIRAVSLGRKIYSLCMLKCQVKNLYKEKHPPRSVLLAATKKQRKLEAQIKILLIKINQKDPHKADAMKQYTNKILGEAKVGIKEQDPLTLGTLLATGPWQKAAIGAAAAGGAYLLGKKVQRDLKQRCYDKHQGYPERIKRCLAGKP